MNTSKKTANTSVDIYIQSFPPQTQRVLEAIRSAIRETAPDAQETIKYGIPTYTLNGNLVHFGGYARHVGFYPTPDAISHFAQELSSYTQAKGSVQFPLDQPLPLALIKKIVVYRIKQSQHKSATNY